MSKIKELFRFSRFKAHMKGRSLVYHLAMALFIVCFVTLIVLNIIAAVQEQTNTATGISGYTVALDEGTDVIFYGTIAKADMKKKITLQYTLSGNAYSLEVEHEDGKFEVHVRVGPGQMGDIIQAQLMANNVVAASETASVKMFCQSVLSDEDAEHSLKVLLSDMLRYGYETQMYIDEHQAAADLLEDVELVEGTPYTPPAYVDIEQGSGEVQITGKSLLLMNMLALSFTTNARAEDGYDVNEDDGKIYIWGIPIVAFFEPIDVGVYKGNTLVSNKISYSPSAYVSRLAEHETLGPLMRALYSYAMSAHRHVGCRFDLRQKGATCQSEGLLTKDCYCGVHEQVVIPVKANTHAHLTKTFTAGGTTVLTCDACGDRWTSAGHAAWENDGTTTDHLVGFPNNRFFNNTPDRLPVRDEAGYLAWLRQADGENTIDEFQMTIPTGAVGLQASNQAKAHISLQIKKLGDPAVPHDTEDLELFQMLLVEDGNGGARWTDDWCILNPIVHVNEDGMLLGWDGVELGMYTDEWTELDILLSFEDGVHEQTGEPIKLIRAVYYANGEGKGTTAVHCTTLNQGFNAIHITGYTCIENTGMAIDNIQFAY